MKTYRSNISPTHFTMHILYIFKLLRHANFLYIYTYNDVIFRTDKVSWRKRTYINKYNWILQEKRGSTVNELTSWSWAQAARFDTYMSNFSMEFEKVHSPSTQHFVQHHSSVADGNSSRSRILSTRSYVHDISLITFYIECHIRDQEITVNIAWRKNWREKIVRW